MKKIICFVFAVMFVFLLASCGESPAVPTETTVTTEQITPPSIYDGVFSDDREPITDFNSLLSYITEAHRAVLTDKSAFEDIEEYLTVEKNLLTSDEILNLREEKTAVETLTRDQALSDAELFFRMMKYEYAGYYYFGGDKVWDPAKDKVMAEIEKKNSITSSELVSIISENIDFVNDGHFIIGTESVCDIYSYYTDSSVRFDKDETGYFTLSDGEKLYYESSDTDGVKIDVSLDADGNLYYGLVYLADNDNSKEKSKIYLVGESGRTDITVEWTKAENYVNPDGILYRYFKEGDVAYISVRSFSDKNKSLQNFLKTGKTLQKAKYIIFDLRGNGGGYMSYPEDWFYNFAETYVAVNRAEITRHTKMTYLSQDEMVTKKITNGAMVKNDRTIFVLVDKNVASAGELMIQYLKTLENVVVVGCNSLGCAMFGGVVDYYLPNSGLLSYFGFLLHLYNNKENTEGVGIIPDIWCDPSSALSCVYELMNKNELYDVSSCEKLTELANAEK